MKFDNVSELAKKRLAELGKKEKSEEAIPQWSAPEPLDEDMDVPEFPIEVFPTWIQNFVESVAISLQVPKDMPAMLVLAVLSTALQKKYVVKIKDDWREPLNLYILNILKVAERKSATLKVCLAPLYEYMQDENRKLAPEIARGQAEKKILEDRLKFLQTKAFKSGDEEIKKEALEVAEELSKLKTLCSVRLIADDISPEKLENLMSHNNNKMSIFSAEGNIFDIIAGRYTNGASNASVFLKSFSGDNIFVDRIGRESISIIEPALSIGLAVQPTVLNGIMGNESFRGTGLLARFLYSMPQSRVGSRDANPEPLEQRVFDTYKANIKKLLEIPLKDDGTVLHFSVETRKKSIDFARSLEPRLIDDLEEIGDWAAKLHGQICRISAILHVAENIENLKNNFIISGQTLGRATLLAEYFIAHAQFSFNVMGIDRNVDDTKKVLNWIRKQDLKEFTLREIFRKFQSRFKKVENLEEPLKSLEEKGYIRRKKDEAMTVGRPKSPVFEVNPYLNDLLSKPKEEQLENTDGLPVDILEGEI